MKRSFYLWITAGFIFLYALGLAGRHPHAVPLPAHAALGYGGPIEIALTASAQGEITDIKVTRHNETPSYITGMPEFLRQFTGRTVHSPLKLGHGIDAMSGATITSRALLLAVKKDLFDKMNLPLPSDDTASEFPWAQLLVPLFLWLIAMAAFLRRSSALRWAAMAGGFVYFGLITHTMLSIVQVVQAGTWHIPGFKDSPLWWLILATALAGGSWFGRVYCGSLCPFALIHELLHLMVRRKRPASLNISPGLDRNARLIKYVLLFVITGLCFGLGNAAAANMEPFITLFSGHGGKMAWFFLALMLVTGIFYFRAWCTYLCPVGALTGLIAIFSVNRIVPAKTCTACDICTNACPVNAIAKGTNGRPVVDMAECITCAKCLRACPVNALQLERGPDEKA